MDVVKLAAQMLGAALPLLKRDAADAESFAKTEFLKIAQTIVGIGEQKASGQITPEIASLLLDMQTIASRNVLLTLKGLGLLAVEDAINAALGVIKDAVNTALGFVLIA